MDIENIKRHFAEIGNTLVQKNHDYGNAFEELWKLKGIGYGADKIFEKALRIETLSREENQVKGESLKDALMDVIGYAALCLDKLNYPNWDLSSMKEEVLDNFKKGMIACTSLYDNSRFKKGDIVTVIGNPEFNYAEIIEVYYDNSVSKYQYWVESGETTHRRIWVYANRLELVCRKAEEEHIEENKLTQFPTKQTPKFNKGDRVKIKDAEADRMWLVGNYGIIKEILYSVSLGFIYYVDVEHRVKSIVFNEDQLELTK